MQTRYPSRVDPWLAIMLAGAPLLVVSLGVFTLTISVGAGVVTIIIGILMGGMIAALSIPCVYILTDTSLRIQCGMLEDEVSLRSVRGAEESTSLWSAPALSLRRVKITLDVGSRVISPKDRNGFLADLRARLGTLESARFEGELRQ